MPSTEIQWFPGHMAKTRRMIRECLQLVDLVIEILDARIPYSSKNPEISSLCENKPILTVFNKSSLSDPAVNDRWVSHYRKNGGNPLFIDCKTGVGLNRIEPEIRTVLQEKIRRYENKGMSGKRLKAMVVGIPNVGKSTFINSFAGAARAKAANKPGVTRGKQWITVDDYDLMDMPGVLWKKFDSLETATNLAFIGSIKDDILDIEELACGLLSGVRAIYPQRLMERYKLDEQALALPPYDLLQAIGAKRGMLISGGEVDTERAAKMLVGEFRASKWGRISLERPRQRAEVTDWEGDDADEDEQ
mgnify:CR=1 FL=1